MSQQAGKARSGQSSSRTQQQQQHQQKPKGEVVSHRNSVECGNNPQPVQRKVIGHYMLGKTIGEGTFGKVKIAIHLPTGEKVGSCLPKPPPQHVEQPSLVL